MRKSEALYYPTVEPPIGWLRSAALFFDTVISFVPAESENAISKELWEFGEETKAWVPYSPTEGTALLVDIPTDKLDHAFEGIAAKKPERLNHFQIEIDREARISVKDHVFVHGSKLSDRVRERLKAYKLMLPEELPQSLINGDWWVVDEQASDLIVSYIADRLAATKGWTSITDHGDCYVFNALQRTDVGVNSTEAENQLASMLITELVPDVIELLPLEKYCELRKRHEPIREQLAIFVDEVVRKNRLNRIENTADLHEAVVECVRDLKKEVLNFRSSPFARTFRRWGAFSIGGLLTIAAPLLDSQLSLPIAGLGVLLRAIDKAVSPQKTTTRGEMVRLLAAERQDVIRGLDIKRFLVA